VSATAIDSSRKTDTSGRKYMMVFVVPEEAAVVRRIFDDFLIGRGYK
jgi:hypothetical protein